jgi:hypothetical protein
MVHRPLISYPSGVIGSDSPPNPALQLTASRARSFGF